MSASETDILIVNHFCLMFIFTEVTLESGIDVGKGMNVGT